MVNVVIKSKGLLHDEVIINIKQYKGKVLITTKDQWSDRWVNIEMSPTEARLLAKHLNETASMVEYSLSTPTNKF